MVTLSGPLDMRVWESGRYEERERWEKSNLHSLLLPFSGFAPVTIRHTGLPSGMCDQKTAPFLATWPKFGPFLATDEFGTILKCNCNWAFGLAFGLTSCFCFKCCPFLEYNLNFDPAGRYSWEERKEKIKEEEVGQDPVPEVCGHWPQTTYTFGTGQGKDSTAY